MKNKFSLDYKLKCETQNYKVLRMLYRRISSVTKDKKEFLKQGTKVQP